MAISGEIDMKIFNGGCLFGEDLGSEHVPDFFHLPYYSVNSFQHGRESLRSVCAGL